MYLFWCVLKFSGEFDVLAGYIIFLGICFVYFSTVIMYPLVILVRWQCSVGINNVIAVDLQHRRSVSSSLNALSTFRSVINFEQFGKFLSSSI